MRENILSLNTAYADSFEETEAALDDAALAAVLTAWSRGDDKEARRIALELKLIIFLGPNPSEGYRRPSHRSGQMRHLPSGRYVRRHEDHGTRARAKEIFATNAARDSRQPDSNRSRRRYDKLAARSGADICVLNRAYDRLIAGVRV